MSVPRFDFKIIFTGRSNVQVHRMLGTYQICTKHLNLRRSFHNSGLLCLPAQKPTASRQYEGPHIVSTSITVTW